MESLSAVKLHQDVSLVKRQAPEMVNKENNSSRNAQDGPSTSKETESCITTGQGLKTTYLPSINPDLDSKSEQPDLQQLIDWVIPPTQWQDGNSRWVQRASGEPSSRLDVLDLQDRLDTLLTEQRARHFGLCPIRRYLYDQVFDELIRQVTIICVERGLLLGRVRDELRLTLATFQSLYDSAVQYGIKKTLACETDAANSTAEENVANLQELNKQLNDQLKEVKRQLLEQQMRHEDAKRTIERRYVYENERLRTANQQLKLRNREGCESIDCSLVSLDPTSFVNRRPTTLSSRKPFLQKVRECDKSFLMELIPCTFVMVICSCGIFALINKLGLA